MAATKTAQESGEIAGIVPAPVGWGQLIDDVGSRLRGEFDSGESMNSAITQFVTANGNLILLCAIPIVCFVIGERVFARMLARSTFLVDSTDGPFEPTSSLSQSIGAPFASASGATTVVGVGICTAYGWAPAYIWAIVVSLFGGGLFACASFWLVRQYPTRGASEIIAALLGRGTLTLFYIVLGVVLCLLAPMLALAAGELLASNSGASLATILAVVVAIVASSVVRSHSIVPVLSIGIALVAISTGESLGVGMQGYVSVNVGEHTQVLSARGIWTLVVAALCGWMAERSRRGGFVASLLGSGASLGLLMIIAVVLICLMVVNPTIVAPAFTSDSGMLQLAPLLVILMTGGAINAFHAFVNDPETGFLRGNGLQIAYARAALDGLLAVTVILTTATIGASAEEWHATVGTINLESPIHLWLAQFAIGVSLLAPSMGISAEFAREFVTFVMIIATLAALERCFRVLHYLMSEVFVSTPVNRIPPNRRWLYIVVAVFIAARLIKRYGIGYELWPLMGAGSQIFTATILGIVIINLCRKAKPARVATTVCIILWILVIAACTLSAVTWYLQSMSIYLLPWLALLIIAVAVASRLSWRLHKVHVLQNAARRRTASPEVPTESG